MAKEDEKLANIRKRDYLCNRNAIKMRNVDFLEEQELEVMDYAPATPEEAHQRIEEAERGIANGDVVAHEYVIKRSYDLLETMQVK